MVPPGVFELGKTPPEIRAASRDQVVRGGVAAQVAQMAAGDVSERLNSPSAMLGRGRRK
jgi:hypothetical protein